MYEFGDAEIEAARRVVASGKLFRYMDREASEASQFETRWSGIIGTRHAVLVNSGTSALICALVGLGIQPGDEVIVPGYTFVATAIAVLSVGAIPIIANVDRTLTLDPQDVLHRIGPRTRAVIAVHMRGFACDMDGLAAVTAPRHIAIVEDVCQAAGGSYRGAMLGSIGAAGAFSFNQFKILSCGDGGAVCTSSRPLYERALIHHDSGCAAFGRNAQSLTSPVFAGQNYRMSEVSAAIMNVQAGRLDSILARLRGIRARTVAAVAWRGLELIEPHDAVGDCATTMAWRCASAEDAQRLSAILRADGFDSVVPVSTGKHVFPNWSPFWLHDAALRESIERNERRRPLDQTLDHLGRTLLLMPTLEWTGRHIERLAELSRAH